jgi:hypothetical protein
MLARLLLQAPFLPRFARLCPSLERCRTRQEDFTYQTAVGVSVEVLKSQSKLGTGERDSPDNLKLSTTGTNRV